MRRLIVLFVAGLALAAAGTAAAHPLGNFTVNRFTAIELSGSRIYLHEVLDLAEIPTFQEKGRVRSPGFAQELARGLALELDGRRVPLRLLAHRSAFRPGAGGLPTLRFEAVYEARGRGGSLSFRDRNFDNRIGWKEIVVRASGGTRVDRTSVPAASVSGELLQYPKDMLRSPLDVRSATASFTLSTVPGRPPELSGRGPVAVQPEGRFERLVAAEHLGAGVVLLALLVAAFWGAAHALTPGHGKAIVAGYLVGSRGKPRHAVLLGLIVTATHTAGVFALGFVTLGLSQFVVPERLYPWLTLISGLLVVGVGATVLRRRFARRHGHDHHHHHHDELDRKGIVGIGLAAGILPCPSALVVLLSAIALHRVALGLALIVAFSAGLAATITGIGLVAVLARRAFGRLSLDGPLVRALPAVSAAVIVLVGLGLTLKTLPEVI
jgi:ABC-type nickel/cobalt efflux system permease component RcnA